LALELAEPEVQVGEVRELHGVGASSSSRIDSR
jgi:hypothetical protein